MTAGDGTDDPEPNEGSGRGDRTDGPGGSERAGQPGRLGELARLFLRLGRTQLNSAWLIAAGALTGILHTVLT